MRFTRSIFCVVLVTLLMTCLQVVWSQQLQAPQKQKPDIAKQYVPSLPSSTEGAITFEELPGSTRLKNQYEQVRGVIFNDVQVNDYSHWPSPFAHGTKAIEGCPGVEFGCDPPFLMTFVKPQRRVKVWFGMSSPVDRAETVTLKILNAQKVLIGEDSKELAVSTGPVPVRDSLEVESKNLDIAYATVSLRASGGGSPGLILDDIEFDSSSPLSDLTIENLETKFGPDRQLVITAVIRNIGAGPSTQSNVEISGPTLWTTTITLELPPLKPEESTQFRWDTTIPSNIKPGTYSYRMVVKPIETTDDADATNNVKEGSFLISSEKPDLSVRILNSGTDWFGGAFVSAEITNTGKADSSATVVEVAWEGRIIGRASVPPLKPQDSVVARVEIQKPSEGQQLFQAVVNPGEMFEETDVSNNSATGTLLISPWPPTGTIPIIVIVICVIGTSTLIYNVSKRKPSRATDSQTPQPGGPVPTFVARPKVHCGKQELKNPPRQNIAVRLRSRMVRSSQQISFGPNMPNKEQP